MIHKFLDIFSYENQKKSYHIIGLVDKRQQQLQQQRTILKVIPITVLQIQTKLSTKTKN